MLRREQSESKRIIAIVLASFSGTNDREDSCGQSNSDNAAAGTPAYTDIPGASGSLSHTSVKSCRSIKPPQASLLSFCGNAEEFPECWAVFESLVYRNTDLEEKILLLKEILKGRAQNSIKGIRLVPENYNWIVKTLCDNYNDSARNRPQIVQNMSKTNEIVNMKPANSSAENCSSCMMKFRLSSFAMMLKLWWVRKRDAAIQRTNASSRCIRT